MPLQLITLQTANSKNQTATATTAIRQTFPILHAATNHFLISATNYLTTPNLEKMKMQLAIRASFCRATVLIGPRGF